MEILTITDSDNDLLQVSEVRHALMVEARDYSDGATALVFLRLTDALALWRYLGEWIARDEVAPLPNATKDGYDWPTEPSTIATDAHAAVYGDREAEYGHPRGDLTRQAIMWTALLQGKLADGEHVEPSDVARCMIATKLSRDVHTHKRDNRVDVAGYAILLDRLETGK